MRKKWKQAVAWMIAGGVLLTSFSTPYEAKAQVRQDDSYTVGEDFSTEEASTIASDASTEDASTEDASTEDVTTEDYGSRDIDDTIWNLDADSESTEDGAGTATESAAEISTETEEPDVNSYVSGDFTYTIDEKTGDATIYSYTGKSATVEIPSELDGHVVRKIKSSAFSDNTSIRKVVIPSTMQEVGDWAFTRCSNLTTVELQPGTTGATIGYNCFLDCTALREITIPGNYLVIGERAFVDCVGLKKVIYEGNSSIVANRQIKKSAFENCSNLTEVQLPQMLYSIGEDAFKGTEIVNLTIPEGTARIGNGAFEDCNKLQTVDIPSTMVAIGDSYNDGAFQNCKKLKTVSLKAGSSSAVIGSKAFLNCVALQGITIPGNYTQINDWAFEGCSSLKTMKYIANASGAEQTIGRYAFSQCGNLTTVTIPATVKNIGEYAFQATSVTTINLQEGIETIGEGAFLNCVKLGSVVIPASVLTIGDDSFKFCNELKTVTIREGNPDAATLGNRAFCRCEKLESIVIPGNYTTIGCDAFYACIALKSLTWKASDSSYANQKIESEAFGDCTNLVTLNLPSTLAEIGWSAFTNTGITKVNIPEGVESIEKGAFLGCKKLVTVTIPSTVTNIGAEYSERGAFANCTNLKYLTIKAGEDDAFIGMNAFANCISLKSVIIPKNYVQIYQNAFDGCSSLKSVYIEDSGMAYTNQQIDKRVFRNCTSLQYLFIPQTVGTINDDQWYIDKLTIFGKAGSYAESYAASRGIPFNANYGSKPVVKKITLSKTTASLNIGKTVTLTARLTPDYTVYPNVTWTSSNTKVARVNQNGTVTGVGKGTAIITCTSTDGRKIKSTCKVSVTNVVAVKRVKLSKTSATLTSGKTLTLKATVTPTNATNKAVTWKSSNPWVASVSSTGKVTAGYSGTATITCTAKDGSGKKATCKITVYSNTEAFVARIYTKALNRNPEPAGLEYWTEEINEGRKTPEEVAQLFFSSPEFVNKHLTNTEYVKVLYRTFMGREYDTNGLNYWVNRLNQGESRKSVMKSFAGCPEFRKIVSSFGL